MSPKWNEHIGDGRTYGQQTIRKAIVRFFTNGEGEQNGRAVGEQNGRATGVQPSGDASPNIPTDDSVKLAAALKLLHDKLNVAVARVAKHGARGGIYDLILEDGTTIPLGSAGDVLGLSKVRAAIFDAKAVVIKSDKKNWPDVAKAIGTLAEILESETDSESMRDWIEAFLDQQDVKQKQRRLSEQPSESREWKLFIINQKPEGFRIGDGRCFVHTASLVRFLYWKLHRKLTTQEIADDLKRLGWKQERIECREGDAVRKSPRYWASPAGNRLEQMAAAIANVKAERDAAPLGGA